MSLNPRALARHLRAMRETIDGLLCDLEGPPAGGAAPSREAPDPAAKIPRVFGHQPPTATTGAPNGSAEEASS